MFALLLLSLTAAAPQVQVKPLSGPAVSGELRALNAEEITLATAEGEKTLPVKEVLTVTPQVAPSAAFKPEVWLELIDGSTLVGSNVEIAKGNATVTLQGEYKLEVATRSVVSVRFKAQDETLGKQWENILKEETTGDVLVIRKKTEITEEDEETGEKRTRSVEALDYLEGVLYDVTAEKVEFDFDGDRIGVPRAKVEGLIYFHPAKREMPEPLVEIAAAGCRFRAKSLSLAGETITLASSSGATVSLPFSQVEQFDYSLGKLQFLSDLTPDSIEWQPFLASGELGARLSQLFAPRSDRNFDGQPLSLRGVKYDKGLALHSRTEISYRLPGKYNRMLATAGIDDVVGQAGHVRLVISGDGKMIKEYEVKGGDDPLPIDLDIAGVRRITILVDFGDGLDIADHLDLCEVRVVK